MILVKSFEEFRLRVLVKSFRIVLVIVEFRKSFGEELFLWNSFGEMNSFGEEFRSRVSVKRFGAEFW